MNATSSVDTPVLSSLDVPDAPLGPLAQRAVDVAVRYRSARSPAAGDWIDIIALPENRVGLAMGRVVGSGPHTRAVIRLLHDAVRNLSSTGLPPDEFLEHLDHLDTRRGEGPDGRSDGFIGRFQGSGLPVCDLRPGLPALHDAPGRASATRRHKPRWPGGLPDLPAGPPLGLGSEPFATAEWKVAEGSQLVLYGRSLMER